MATFKTLPSGGVQLTIKNKLLPKGRLWATFDSMAQAESYARQLEGLLAQGVIPSSLLERTTAGREIWTIGRCVAEYLRHNGVKLSESKLLDTVLPSVAEISTGQLNYEWAEDWVRTMKRAGNLAPSTIRHRHGALARCLDWMIRKHPEIMAQNPLRLLKRGFATYTEADTQHLAAQGKQPKHNVERDRRLHEDEEARIMRVLETMPDERAMFVLALETAMRMRECYTLELQQISLDNRTVYLSRTKNGDNRQVPLSSPALAALQRYIAGNAEKILERDGRLFPFWNGDRDETALDIATRDLSRVYAQVFDAAGAGDLHFHDLRHEATCRLYLKTKLSDVLIAKITGHRDLRMLKRYASLRGSDLAQHLW